MPGIPRLPDSHRVQGKQIDYLGRKRRKLGDLAPGLWGDIVPKLGVHPDLRKQLSCLND